MPPTVQPRPVNELSSSVSYLISGIPYSWRLVPAGVPGGRRTQAFHFQSTISTRRSSALKCNARVRLAFHRDVEVLEELYRENGSFPNTLTQKRTLLVKELLSSDHYSPTSGACLPDSRMKSAIMEMALV